MPVTIWLFHIDSVNGVIIIPCVIEFLSSSVSVYRIYRFHWLYSYKITPTLTL